MSNRRRSLLAVTILALIAVFAVELYAGNTASAGNEVAATSIRDCKTVSIKDARDAFKRLDGTKSRAWEWKRISPSKIKHIKGPRVRGEVPENHYVVGKNNSFWSMEGKTIVKKRFSLRCIPDSGTFNADAPPLASPAVADDASYIYGGNPGSWDAHLIGSTSYLTYNGGLEKLGGFTVPFQCYVEGLRSWRSDVWDYYTPGDLVRPSYVLQMVCWRQGL